MLNKLGDFLNLFFDIWPFLSSFPDPFYLQWGSPTCPRQAGWPVLLHRTLRMSWSLSWFTPILLHLHRSFIGSNESQPPLSHLLIIDLLWIIVFRSPLVHHLSGWGSGFPSKVDYKISLNGILPALFLFCVLGLSCYLPQLSISLPPTSQLPSLTLPLCQHEPPLWLENMSSSRILPFWNWAFAVCPVYLQLFTFTLSVLKLYTVKKLQISHFDMTVNVSHTCYTASRDLL